MKYLDTKFIRLSSEKNIQKFKSAVNNIDWEPLYNYDNANSAYQFFQDSVIHLNIKTACIKNGDKLKMLKMRSVIKITGNYSRR